MLNVMRDTLKYSKWILALVVLSFILFFGPGDWHSCREEKAARAAAMWVARVDGRDIDLSAWQAHAQNLEAQYRQMFGANWEQLRKNLNVGRRAADDMIVKQLILRDAERLGLVVADEEIASLIKSHPSLQRNGAFVGAKEYRQAVQRGMFPPYRTPEAFEAAVREDLLAGKWRQLVGASVIVGKEEIEAEFRRRHEKSTFDYLALPVGTEASALAPGDAELEAFYRSHPDKFPKGEGRRVLYVLFDEAALADRVTVSDAEVEEYYKANLSQFEAPEQRRARHVLVSVAGDAAPDVVEAARRKAADVAQQARTGDFAALAEKFSDDPGSKAQGGDLGLFARGRMVPEFDQAVFSLEKGVVSEPVRSPYGFHVIKVEEIVPAGQQPLAAVKEQIRGQLRFPRLRDEGARLAKDLRAKAKDAAGLRSTAESMKLTLREAGIVLKNEPVPGLGPVPALLDAVFATAKDGVTDVVDLPRGPAVAAVTEVVPDFQPPLAARRDRVLAEYRQTRGRDEARAKLAAAVARAGGDLEKAARELKLQVKKTEPAYTRGTFLPDVGADPALDQAAFSGPAGVASAAIAASQAAVVIKVTGREAPNMAGLAAEEATIRDGLREPIERQLIEERVQALQKAVKVEYNLELLQRG